MDSFVIVEENKVKGVVTKGKLLSSLNRLSLDTTVSEIASADFKEVSYTVKLAEIFNQLKDSHDTIFIVKKNDELMGMITFDTITKYFLFESVKKKLRKAKPRVGWQ
jgi:predicted transcriptional regulator